MVDVIPVYLFLSWNKSFFGHLLARFLDSSMIDALVSIKSDGASVERVTDGIHDQDIWPIWICYIPSRTLLFSSLIL